jgi:hypothetical protein
VEQKPHQSPNVRVQSLSKCQKQLRAWQTGGVHVWFNDYNSYHPHSALGYLPPKLFREKQAVN